MGKIELDHTGSGSGVTLSSDGTDLLLDGTAVGGSPDLFAENWNGTTTQPSATGVNAVAIGTGSNSTGTGALSGPHSNAGGNYSFAAAIGNSTSSYGSQGNNSVAFGANSLSYGLNSAALGAGAQAMGTGSAAVRLSYSSGTDSFAAAIGNNTSTYGATGANSVAIGDRAKATGSRAFATGYASIASGNGAKAFGGFGSGTGTLASKEGSTAIGDGAKSEVSYKVAISTRSFAAQGDAQTGITTLRAQTTNTTPIALYSDTNLPDTGNQVILPNKSAFAFHGTIVARQQASARHSMCSMEGRGIDPQGRFCWYDSAGQQRNNCPRQHTVLGLGAIR